MGQRWAKPREHGQPDQLALPGFGVPTLSERPRIETDPVALGSVDTSREAAAVAQSSACVGRDAMRQFLQDGQR